MKWFGHSATALWLTSCLAVSPTLAPEHIHEAGADHDHAIVHRHLSAHHHGHHSEDLAPDADHHSDRTGVLAAGDDDHVVWLTQDAVQATTHRVAPNVAALRLTSEALPVPTGWQPIALFDAAPPHGPPRQSHSLRAPPSLLS